MTSGDGRILQQSILMAFNGMTCWNIPGDDAQPTVVRSDEQTVKPLGRRTERASGHLHVGGICLLIRGSCARAPAFVLCLQYRIFKISVRLQIFSSHSTSARCNFQKVQARAGLLGDQLYVMRPGSLWPIRSLQVLGIPMSSF
jgi:hypothetical protein